MELKKHSKAKGRSISALLSNFFLAPSSPLQIIQRKLKSADIHYDPINIQQVITFYDQQQNKSTKTYSKEAIYMIVSLLKLLHIMDLEPDDKTLKDSYLKIKTQQPQSDNDLERIAENIMNATLLGFKQSMISGLMSPRAGA